MSASPNPQHSCRRTQLRADLCCVQVAVAKLEAAKEVEDGMSYMEPPRLYQPIRHCLGYVLSNVTGDHAGAEQVGSSFPSLLCAAAVAELQPCFANGRSPVRPLHP